MFRRFLGSAHRRHAADDEGRRERGAAGETATVRRIVARLEAMPPGAGAVHRVGRVHAGPGGQRRPRHQRRRDRRDRARAPGARRPRRGDRRAGDPDGEAPGQDDRRRRGLQRHAGVQGPRQHGRSGSTCCGPASRSARRTGRSPPRRTRWSTRSPASWTSRTPRSTRSAPSTTSSCRPSSGSGGSPRAADRAPLGAPRTRLTRGDQPRRNSTRPSPNRRRTSASSSAS